MLLRLLIIFIFIFSFPAFSKHNHLIGLGVKSTTFTFEEVNTESEIIFNVPNTYLLSYEYNVVPKGGFGLVVGFEYQLDSAITMTSAELSGEEVDDENLDVDQTLGLYGAYIKIQKKWKKLYMDVALSYDQVTYSSSSDEGSASTSIRTFGQRASIGWAIDKKHHKIDLSMINRTFKFTVIDANDDEITGDAIMQEILFMYRYAL